MKKKLISLLLTGIMLVSTVTGCSLDMSSKVDKNGKVKSSLTTTITEDEVKLYSQFAFATVGDEMGDSELTEEETYASIIEELNNDESFTKNVVDGKTSWTTTQTSTEKAKGLHATYCSISVTDANSSADSTKNDADGMFENTEALEEFVNGLEIKSKYSVTFPYKIKTVNAGGKISKNGKTVTWDLMKLPKGTKKLKAYTVKYKK